MVNTVASKPLIAQSEYVKKLRPLLPEEAFTPSKNYVLILGINLTILLLGWGIADYLDRWNVYWLWLYLPLAVIMGNSIIVALFSTHNIMHGATIKNTKLQHIVGLFGLSMLWMPPSLWKAVHNREHHNNTNAVKDPDRNYLNEQPKTWGKWIQNQFVPSAEVNPIALIIGMAHAWGVHAFRNLSSVFLFNNGATKYPVFSFTVNSQKRKAIGLETLFIIGIHLSIITFLDFHPIKLLLGYFLPIWIGHGGAMFYIYTNHMLCRMTDVNDPLINSISLRVPKIFDILHLNFSYHTEHHVFPGVNSDYYPLVQELLQTHYPDRFNLLEAGTAWKLLLQTPRHYQDENTFTDWMGEKSIPCPLSETLQKG
ncbi:MAG: fatty acid desaturase [Cyanobacteria bacterium P01_E01_bin.42]